MYEALISHLRECAKYDKFENTFEEAADTIEYLSSYFKYYCPHYIQNVHDGDDKSLCAFWGCDVKSLPRWIPVTERLPEEHSIVLLYSYGDVVVGTYDSEYKEFRELNGFHRLCTHWMPRPVPPKEET